MKGDSVAGAALDTPDNAADSTHAAGALVVARWALLTLLCGLALVQAYQPMLFGPQPWGLVPPLGVLAAGITLNTLVARRPALTRGQRRTALTLVADVALLTAFLALSGAAENPFTMLYFVPVALATLLPPTYTWLTAGACLLGFAGLLALTASTRELSGHFLHHLLGMWIGLAVSGGLITAFVHRIASAAAGQRAELERAKKAATEARHLAALGGLAAGAAHELGTPLGTIRLLAADLDSMPDAERSDAILQILDQIERCKGIIHGLANPELSARVLESRQPWSLTQLASALPSKPLLELRQGARHAPAATAPFEIIGQILRELVTNAERACRHNGGEVTVIVDADASRARISVRDTGPGMSADVAQSAFDAFYSTHPEGHGLGLFLARAHLRQIGGHIQLTTQVGSGTQVDLSFPLDASSSV